MDDENSLDTARRAVLQTLIYSDLFDYPLTALELWLFLKSKKKVLKSAFEKVMKENNSLYIKKKVYYCLPDRQEIINKRITRKEISNNKKLIFKKVVNCFYLIPTIRFVGISGSLALDNAKKTDDIDLFIIVKKNSIWITRITLLSILELMNLRRKPGIKFESNKICVNLMIDECKLALTPDRQDVFTAHEIVQLQPIFSKNNCYQSFILANIWIKKFLPNSLKILSGSKFWTDNSYNKFNKKLSIFFVASYVFYPLIILEPFARFFQLIYMADKRTNEYISDSMLAFHPFDQRKYILNKYRLRLGKYNLTL